MKMEKQIQRNILTMNILVAFFWMSQYCYVPNLPQYAQSFGADALILGIIGGVYGIAQILLRIPLGLIADNTGKDRGIMVIGALVLTASCGIFIFANSAVLIVLGRLTAGAAAAWWALQGAAYANYHRVEAQVKAQGILSASANWGKVAASLVGGLIAQYMGMHAIFVFAFASALLCIFLSVRIKDIPRPEQKKPAKSFRDLLPLFKSRDMIVFSALTTIGVLLFFAGPTYFTVVAAQELGATSMDFGLLNMTFYIFSGLICLWVGSRTYKKLGNTTAIALGFLLTAVSCVPYLYHINLPIIYLTEALAGIGTGISCTAVSGLVLRVFPQEVRGVANAVFQSLVASGALIGPVLVGSLIKSVSFDASYWALVIIAVAAAGMCYLLIPRKYARI